MASYSDMPSLVYSSDDEDNRAPNQRSRGSMAWAHRSQLKAQCNSKAPGMASSTWSAPSRLGPAEVTRISNGVHVDEFLATASDSNHAGDHLYVHRWITSVKSEFSNCPYVYKSYLVIKIYLLGPVLFGIKTKSSVYDEMLLQKYVDQNALKTPRPISYEDVMKVQDFEAIIDKVINCIQACLQQEPEDMEEAVTNTDPKLFSDHLPVNIRENMNRDLNRKTYYVWAFSEFVEHVRCNHRGQNIAKKTYLDNLRADRDVYEWKEKGNASFKSKNFTQAVMYYSKAIDISRMSYVLYGNRAQAYLKLNQPGTALCDGLRSVLLNPDWPKGYYRFAEAFFDLGYYDEAFKINQDGCRRCTTDAHLQGQKDKIKATLREQRQSKKEAMAKEDIQEMGRRMDGDVDKNDIRAAARKVLKPSNVETASAPQPKPAPASIPTPHKKPPSTIRNPAPPPPVKVLENPEILYRQNAQEGTKFLLQKDYSAAAQHYQTAISQILHLKTKPSEMNQLLLKYACATALVTMRTDKDVRSGLKLLDSLPPSKTFPLGYLGKVRALVIQNRYTEAIPVVGEGLQIFRGRCIFGIQRWPASTTVMPDTEAGELRNQLQKLLMLCRYPPSPDAVCCRRGCSGYYKPQIYRSDTDFSGYVRVQCWEQCILEFHNECWRAYKNEEMLKKADKDIISGNKPCPTPDCHSTLAKIVIYDDQGNQLKEFIGKKVTQPAEKKKIVKMAPSSLKTIQQRAQKKANRHRKRHQAENTTSPEKDATENIAEATLAAVSSANHSSEPPVEDLTRFTKVLKKGDDDLDMPFKGACTKPKRVRKRQSRTDMVITPDVRFKDNPGRSVVDDSIFNDPYQQPIMPDMGLDCLDNVSHGNPYALLPDQETDLLRFMDMTYTSRLERDESPHFTPSSPLVTYAENLCGPWASATSSPRHSASSPLDEIIYAVSEVEEDANDQRTAKTSPVYRPPRPLDEDTVNAVRNSVFSHFSTLLRDTGPMNVEDPQLLRAVADLDPSTQGQIKEAGGLGSFLRQSALFYNINGFVCNYDMQDIHVAMQLAVTTSSTASYESLLSPSRESLSEISPLDRNDEDTKQTSCGDPALEDSKAAKTGPNPCHTSSVAELVGFHEPDKKAMLNGQHEMMENEQTDHGSSMKMETEDLGETADGSDTEVLPGNRTNCSSNSEPESDDKDSDNSYSDIDEDDPPYVNGKHDFSFSGTESTKHMDTSTTSADDVFFDSKDDMNSSFASLNPDSPLYPAAPGKPPPGFTLPSVRSPQSLWSDYFGHDRPADHGVSPEAVSSQMETTQDSPAPGLGSPQPPSSGQVSMNGHEKAVPLFAPSMAKFQNINNVAHGEHLSEPADEVQKDQDALLTKLEALRSDFRRKETQCTKAETKVKDLNVQLHEARTSKAKIEKEQRRFLHESNEEKLKLNKEMRALRNQQEQLTLQLDSFKKKGQKEKEKIDASTKAYRNKTKQLETENEKLQEGLEEKERLLSASLQESQSLSEQRAAQEEKLRLAFEQRAAEKTRAQEAEKQLLKLKLEVTNSSLEQRLHECEVNCEQFSRHIKSLYERKQPVPSAMTASLGQWSQTKETIKQLLVENKSIFQKQMTLVSEGIRLSSFPEQKIPRPPTPPNVTLQMFLKDGPPSAPPCASADVAGYGARDMYGSSASQSSSASSTPPPTMGATASDMSLSKSKNSSYNRVLENLRGMFPIYTKSELRDFIQRVRAVNGGSLSGLTLDQIIQKVTEVILEEQGMHRPDVMPTRLCTVPPANVHSSPWESHSLEDEDSCVICLIEMSGTFETMHLKCGHRFHTECIRQWLQKQSTCPNCRVHALLPDEYPPLC